MLRILKRAKRTRLGFQAVQDCEGHNSCSTDLKIVHQNELLSEIEMNQEVPHQPNADLPHVPRKPEGPDREKSSRQERKKTITSSHSLRPRKREVMYTYPALPQVRRMTLPWTNVEEEALREGVSRFASSQEKTIPWKKILEFGGDVFQKGRTTVDLKDKWRNICKVAP